MFSCIKFFQIRDVPTQIPGHPGHSLSKTTEKGHLHKGFVRDMPTSGSLMSQEYPAQTLLFRLLFRSWPPLLTGQIGIAVGSDREIDVESMSNQCWIDAKSTPEKRRRARRIRGWAPGILCLINPSQHTTRKTTSRNPSENFCKALLRIWEPPCHNPSNLIFRSVCRTTP